MNNDWDEEVCCGYGAAMKWLHDIHALGEGDGETKSSDSREKSDDELKTQNSQLRPPLAQGNSPNAEPPARAVPLRTPHASAVGIDIVAVARIEDAVKKYGKRFLDRIFTARERDYALGKRRCGETLAGRFAAKEAFMKAMGKRLPWQQVEVGNNAGAPFIRFCGQEFGGLSISHERSHAVAVFLAPCSLALVHNDSGRRHT